VADDTPDTFTQHRSWTLVLVRLQLMVCEDFEGEASSEDTDSE